MKKKTIQVSIAGILFFITLCACSLTMPQEEGNSSEAELTYQDFYDLGVRYLSEGNFEDAIIAFTVAIEIDSKQTPAYVGRGDAYVLSGETEENLAAAKADYERAIKLDETSTEAYLGLADVYIRQEDYEKALEILWEAIKKTGENQSISDRIAEIEIAHIPEMVEAGDYSAFFTDDLMKPQDWIVNGKPIYECELADFQAEFPCEAGSALLLTEGHWTYRPQKTMATNPLTCLSRKEGAIT